MYPKTQSPSGLALSMAIAVALSLQAASACADDAASRFDLPSESLDKALRDFAVQTHCQISYEPQLVAGITAPEIRGEYRPSAVLSILLKNTKLRAVSVNDDMIQVVAASATTTRNLPGDAGTAEGVKSMRVAYAGPDARAGTSGDTQAMGTGDADTSNESGNNKKFKDKDLEEITVTGTHIRGITDSASPTHVYTREDIDATGSTTVQQFLQTIPQNFGGGAGESTAFSGAAQVDNRSFGNGANLRGLGNNTTLVLINSHRVAPGNRDGDFVDLSMIPLTAIERIEIVTDGASAIYGSDAVGGVINIVLRTKFEGADTHVEYGTGTSDSHRSVQLGQAVGHEWGGGSAVLSYQYFDQTPLSAADRSYTQNTPLPFQLIPEQVQQAAVTSLEQQIIPGLRLIADGIYSQRDAENSISLGGPDNVQFAAQVRGYGASIGLIYNLPRETRLQVSADYSESDTKTQSYLEGDLSDSVYSKSAITSANVNLDGILAALPAGAVRYAVGAQYRKETFGEQGDAVSGIGVLFPSRNIRAGYVELHAPLLGPNLYSGLDPALEVTAADRQERYSDFGSTNNPEFGVIWKPVSGVKVRGTWGTSFNAPQLYQLNPIPYQVNLSAVTDPSKEGGMCNYVPASNSFSGGCTNALTVYGGNPSIQPQNAATWTLGLDLTVASLPGLMAKLTYYDIVIKNAISIPGVSGPVLSLVNEPIFGPKIVQVNPSSTYVQQLEAEPGFTSFYNLNPNAVGVILNETFQNLSKYITRGLDTSVAYKTTVAGTQIESGIDGTYILNFETQSTSATPAVSDLDTIYNPVRLRLRGRTLLTYGPVSGGAYLNYTSSYTNNSITPFAHVASWTTADAVLSYSLKSDDKYLNGLSLSLSVINVTGRDPPFALNSNGYQINYDGANASPLGRFVSIRVGKRW